MVSPALVSQKGGNISAQFKRAVEEGGIQFQTSLEALIRSATRLRILRILKLRRVREATTTMEPSNSYIPMGKYPVFYVSRRIALCHPPCALRSLRLHPPEPL
jgi:hypothetical protein